MKKEVEEKLRKELRQIAEQIQLEEIKIRENPPYLLIKELIKEKREEKSEILKEINILNNEVYNKYTLNSWSWYRGIRLKDIKSSVKQGIKNGLGEKTLIVIEDDLVRIVKQLIKKDLDTSAIKKLQKIGISFDDNINKLCSDRDKLIADGLKTLDNKRNKICRELRRETDIKDKKLATRRAEAKIKINNLSHYMGNIIKEVNKRLVLDSLSKNGR